MPFMLAFSDPAMARLMIAATAIPQRKRRAWLDNLARQVVAKKQAPATLRSRKNQRRYYRRQSSPNPERVYDTTVSDRDLCALADRGFLADADLKDRDTIQKALSNLVRDLAQK